MGKRVCLYSGRDVEPENWMNVFDYIKVGSYQQFYLTPVTNIVKVALQTLAPS